LIRDGVLSIPETITAKRNELIKNFFLILRDIKKNFLSNMAHKTGRWANAVSGWWA